MQPNLQHGDYFFIMRQFYAGAPRRGDLLVFKLPSSGHIDYVKRLIGMPGDRVQLRGGQLYINDKPVAERPLGMGQGDLPGPSGPQPVKLFEETTPEGRSYKIQLSPSYESAGDTGEYVLPPHCYFTLGDNRDNSLDSRFDPGLAPDDPKLGGCGWDATLDEKVGDQAGVGFVPEKDLIGVVVWDAIRQLDEGAPHG
jgi:signal peptidase I